MRSVLNSWFSSREYILYLFADKSTSVTFTPTIKSRIRFPSQIRDCRAYSILKVFPGCRACRHSDKFMEDAKRYSVRELGYVHLGTFVESSNVRVALKICNQGPRCAQTAATQCVQYLNPKAVIFVGICATLKPEKAKLGHVILSYRLDTYDDQKLEKDGSVDNRSTQTRPGVLMRNLFLEAGVGWKPPLKSPQNSNFQIHQDKPILSGSKLVNNRKERDELSERFPEPYGLEMEGAGKQSLTMIINTLHSGKHISKAEGW